MKCANAVPVCGDIGLPPGLRDQSSPPFRPLTTLSFVNGMSRRLGWTCLHAPNAVDVNMLPGHLGNI
jgi:hypothetical protein